MQLPTHYPQPLFSQDVPCGMMLTNPYSGLHFSLLHLFLGGALYVLILFCGPCPHSLSSSQCCWVKFPTCDALPAHGAQRILRAQCPLPYLPSRGVFGSLLESSSPQTWADLFFSTYRHVSWSFFATVLFGSLPRYRTATEKR